MKKYLLFIILFASISMQAQRAPLVNIERNLVLVEIATGTWCTYCPGAAMGADDLIDNGYTVAIVENHGGDSYANDYSNARNSFYNVTGYPTAFFDGLIPVVGGSHSSSMYGSYIPKVNQRMGILTPFDIDFTFTDNGNNNYSLSVDISKVGDYSNEVVLHVFITESGIQENWQGQTHLNFVNRLMVPDQNGTTLNFSSSNIVEDLSFNVDPTWNIDECEIVVAIQDMLTKEVLNAAKASLNQPIIPDVLVSVSPSNINVNTSEIFETNIIIAEVENIGSFELGLDFDPSLLQVNSVTLGDFLGSTGRTIFPLNNTIDNNAGSIGYAVTTLGSSPPGASGNGTLLTVEWTAASDISDDAITQLILQNLQVTHPDGEVIPTASEDGTVNILACYSRDFDCDCDVDIVDVTMAAYTYGTTVGDANYDPKYDLDNDGDVDIVDITMVTYDYGWNCNDKIYRTEKVDNETEEPVILGFSEIRTIDVSNQIYEQDMIIENIENFGGLELQLSYYSENCEVLDLIDGEFRTSSKREMIELDRAIDPINATLSYAFTGLGFNQKGESGTGTILTIRYQSKYPQQAGFEILNAQIVKPNASLIPFKNQTQQNNYSSQIISIYPNPVINEFSIDFYSVANEKIQFVYYDVLGNILFQTDIRSEINGKASISNLNADLPTGVYYVGMIVNGEVVDAKKMMVK